MSVCNTVSENTDFEGVKLLRTSVCQSSSYVCEVEVNTPPESHDKRERNDKYAEILISTLPMWVIHVVDDASSKNQKQQARSHCNVSPPLSSLIQGFCGSDTKPSESTGDENDKSGRQQKANVTYVFRTPLKSSEPRDDQHRGEEEGTQAPQRSKRNKQSCTKLQTPQVALICA